MKLFNSYTQSKEEFAPIDKSKVTMYVCGITPYDTTHLGHAFTYTVFDVLRRYFEYKGYKVEYTQNVTDIDDDILRKAKETGKTWKETGQFWTDKFLNDMKTLNIGYPTNYVKATETMQTIIDIVHNLTEKSFAYEKEGNVYFRVSKFPDYGKLSHYNRDQMILLSRERGADPDDPNKEDPLDFILWQKSKTDEPTWESPWGNGRPGWHIECSAMVYKYAGKQIDIHGGGRDLIYPHHESEIAQSETFSETKPYVKYWMHSGAVMYQGEKMSKSLGNLVMVSDLLKTYSPNTIKYVLLSHPWRIPWEFQESELESAWQAISFIGSALKLDLQEPVNPDNLYEKAFSDSMDDDLNTPEVLQLMRTLAAKIHDGQSNFIPSLKTILTTLGFTLSS